MSASPPVLFDDDDPRGLVRWALAGSVVVLAYAAAVAAYLFWQQPAQEIGDDSNVVTVELAPIDTTPDAQARDVTPAQETMVESKAEPQPQPKPPEPQETKIEPLPRDNTPTAVPEPQPKPPEKVQETRPPAPMTAERVKGGAPQIAPSWETSLVRRLQRSKRYPSAARERNEQGVVLLSFSLDRNGHVLERHIARSSGYRALDDEALAMIARAEPLPAFAPSMPQARLDLTVPIRFSLR